MENNFKLGIKIVNAIIGNGKEEGFSYSLKERLTNDNEDEQTSIYQVIVDNEEHLVAVVNYVDSYDNNGGIRSIKIVQPVTKEITQYEEII